MNDIDIPALIERLKDSKDWCAEHGEIDEAELLGEAITALDQLRWRRVGDEYPDNEEAEYFLTLQYKYRDAEAREKYGYDKSWAKRCHNPGAGYFLGETEDNPVTHWLPLPSPPQESSQ